MKLKIRQLFPFLQYGDLFFILSLLLFQLLFIFQGLDFADQGSYATLYQQIFIAPETIQYHFPYWLTAIIGGAWLKVFPTLGLLGIRIAGVLITTLTVFIAYSTLKRYMKINNLRLGVFMAVIIMSYNLPSELYYNNLSILFWVTGSILMFKGLIKGFLSLLFISGVLVGLNIFIRLPNVLGIIIIVLYFTTDGLLAEV